MPWFYIIGGIYTVIFIGIATIFITAPTGWQSKSRGFVRGEMPEDADDIDREE